MAFLSTRRDILTAAAAAGATLGLPPLARAQSFPDKSKPIVGIVAYAAGSGVDVVARAYAQGMSEALGTNVVVENRPGAEGVIGMQAAKSAVPDGHTILFTSISTQTVNPHLFKRPPYDALNDFTPLAGTVKVTLLLNASPSLGAFKSAREFIQAAKAAPGKYSYASISATTRLAAEMFAKAAGIKLLNIPYKNFSDLTSDLASGRVDLLMADASGVGAAYKQGVRPLAAASLKRLPSMPDVPTFEEQGLAGLEIIGWHGAYAPAKTPAPVVARLRQAVQQAAKSKSVRDYCTTFGVETLELAGEEFAAFQRAEFDKWGKAVRDAGLQGTF